MAVIVANVPLVLTVPAGFRLQFGTPISGVAVVTLPARILNETLTDGESLGPYQSDASISITSTVSGTCYTIRRDGPTAIVQSAHLAQVPYLSGASVFVGESADGPAAPAGWAGSQFQSLVSGASNLVGSDVAAPATNLNAAVGAAGVLTGNYYYTFTYLLNDGTETPPWSGTASVVAPAAQQVNLSSIGVASSSRVIARKLYRSVAGPVDPKDYRYLATINDNTTTAFVDNVADGSLGAPVNWLGTTSGTVTTSSGVALQGLGGNSQSLAMGTGTTAGYASVSLGAFAGGATTTGRRNTFAGVYAGASITTGYENSMFGTHAGNYLTTQTANVFVGTYAGFNAGTGAGAAQYNTGLGHGALQATNGTGIGSYCVAVGYRALYNINTADQCVGVGPFAGQFANASRQLFVDTGGSSRANLAAQQNEGLIYGEIPNSGNVQTQRLNINGSVRLGSSTSPTVANLPAAAAGLQGCRRYVTDSTVAASGNYGATVAGGGANCVPVFCTGAAWIIA